MARIVGSDIAHAVPLTLVAGLEHLATGSIDWGLLGVLLWAPCRALDLVAIVRTVCRKRRYDWCSLQL